MGDCTRLQEPVEWQPLSCQKTQCIDAVRLISASSFQTAWKMTRLLDKRLIFVVFCSHSWSGRKSFFWTPFRSIFPLVCIHVSPPPSPPPGMVTNCRVGCQRAALHFEDDSQWHGAFDPLPGFVNKEYTLIDAAHIMAVWELAGEKKTRLSCWKSPKTPHHHHHHHRLCRRGPSCRKALLSCFQHLTLCNAYYESSTLRSIYLSFLSRGSIALFQRAFDQHPRPYKEKKKRKKKAQTSRNADWVSYSYVLKWTRRCLSRAQCDAAKWNVDQPLINHNGW